ncbi:MAG: hypothetical protein ACK5YO_04985, partial [Planctomyces sp.]
VWFCNGSVQDPESRELESRELERRRRRDLLDDRSCDKSDDWLEYVRRFLRDRNGLTRMRKNSSTTNQRVRSMMEKNRPKRISRPGSPAICEWSLSP